MRKKKTLGTVIIILIILFLIVFVFLEMFSIKEITIKGSKYYSEEDIKAKVMTKITDRNTLLFYLRYHLGEGNQIPFIQQIDVEMKSRSSIEVVVYEKRMIGCIRNMNEYIYFDKDGTVMEVINERIEGIPFFTGLRAEAYGLYERLVVEDTSIFSTILSFSQLIERYELAIDKIHISKIHGVTMYSGNVKILFGKQKMYDAAIAELNHMLPKVLELNQAGTIDMRNFVEGQATTIFKPETKKK